jgi:glycosyltransferase involved in cell wall biosynthesis
LRHYIDNEDRTYHSKYGGAVQFIGHVFGDALRKFYGACSVFTFPSKVETFGNPLVEAMADECSILCANTTAMLSVTVDSVRLVDPNDQEQMTLEMHIFFESPKLFEEFSTRARTRRQTFSWESTARSTADALLDAAGE